MDPNIFKPKTMAELLPELGGFISKDVVRSYTEKRQPRPTAVAQGSRTAEKCYKPMSLSELTATLSAFKATKSPSRNVQTTMSNKKKWNSSIKVEKKTVSHTVNSQLKHHSVRKTLNFQQSKPPKMSTFASRMTVVNPETPKFPKPDRKVKKSLLPAPACKSVRISGIQPMPSSTSKPLKSRMTLANKENVPNQATVSKTTATPKSLHQKVLLSVADTPILNASRKYSSDTQSDASFLQHEKDIDKITEEHKPVSKEKTPEKVDVSLSASTPFRQYRNLNEYFNNSSDAMDQSEACQDDTIMSFDKPNKREESVIVSLCDMLQKTNVTNTEILSTELEDLLEVKKRIANNIEMMKSSIKTINMIIENEQKSFQYVCEQIKKTSEQVRPISQSDKENTRPEPSQVTLQNKNITPPTVGKPCSVIKSCLKSPSYKIPKKNATSLRKKVCYNATNSVRIVSPLRNMNDKALDMYMNMKGHMNFLSTPAKHTPVREPDTPSITSHNLQKQLDKLYES